jgi:hypothetical protein
MHRTPFLPLGFALGLGALVLTGCGPREGAGPAQAPAATSAEDAGYLAPPALTDAVRSGGQLILTGAAPAGARVQLASPDGRMLSAVADARGGWSLSLPAPAAPAMFAFSAQIGDRIVRGEGAVLLPPAPAPPALLLRAGFGALSIGQPPDGPAILAVDYDASGGAAVAGLAPANTTVRLSLDGVFAASGQADGQGRFAVMAFNRTLAPGARVVAVETTAGQAEMRIAVSPPAPLQGEAYRAVRQGTAWRIDWAPPGGGVQTSLVFDAPGPTP